MIHGKLTYVGLAIALGYAMGACSSDTTAPTPPTEGGTSTGGSKGGGSGTGGTSSGGAKASGGAGMGGGGTMGGGAGGGTPSEAGAKPTCSSYCDAIMANCTGGDGSDGGKTNQQYNAKANCMAVCALFPAGKAGDTT